MWWVAKTVTGDLFDLSNEVVSRIVRGTNQRFVKGTTGQLVSLNHIVCINPVKGKEEDKKSDK